MVCKQHLFLADIVEPVGRPFAMMGLTWVSFSVIGSPLASTRA
ncbi:hypothetical protein [Sphingomonas gei]|nr:hypothetical protein [Sphingomonas gei]